MPQRSSHLLIACLVVALAFVLPAAHASKVYRWTDRGGITHYGDQRPEQPVRHVAEIPVRAEPGAVARLRVERHDGRYLVWADNQLSGPIEVMLHFSRQQNMLGDPELPARATVSAEGSSLVATLSQLDADREGSFELRMESLPGNPSAAPRDVAYLLPLQQQSLQIDQGFDGSFSHTDPQNRYAIDFAAAEGTPVLAAREGLVMQVERDFDQAGLDLGKFGGRANFIRILHDDGSMALYAHLAPEGVLVRPGQRVRTGQRIGLSGNTGFTTGPHLHFAIQVNRGMRLLSIPFQMSGPSGPLDISDGRHAAR